MALEFLWGSPVQCQINLIQPPFSIIDIVKDSQVPA